MEELLQVGKITSTHGLKGEVKVFPTTDDPERFEDLETVILKTAREELILTIENVRYFKQSVILKFKGIDDINEIEKYRGCSLWIDRKDAVELDTDEYFIVDLIGMKVITEDGTELGSLKDVMTTGANDVYIVVMPDQKEILLPAIHECILKVDVEKKEMLVHLMPGLL